VAPSKLAVVSASAGAAAVRPNLDPPCFAETMRIGLQIVKVGAFEEILP
jgi:hypothetical protein